MIVYILQSGKYEQRMIEGVFTSITAAQIASRASAESWSVDGTDSTEGYDIQAYRLDEVDGWLGYDVSEWPSQEAT